MKNYIEILRDYLVIFNEMYDGTTGRVINEPPINQECFFYLDALAGVDVVLKGYYKRIPVPDRDQIRAWYLVQDIERMIGRKFQ